MKNIYEAHVLFGTGSEYGVPPCNLDLIARGDIEEIVQLVQEYAKINQEGFL